MNHDTLLAIVLVTLHLTLVDSKGIQLPGQNLPLAIAAPSASTASLAQTTSGSTPPDPT